MSRLVCILVILQFAVAAETVSILAVPKCGTRPGREEEVGDKRITGGKGASPGRWPWMAALYVDGPPRYFKCGASLISDRWVITAGHCGRFKVGMMMLGANVVPEQLKVRLGEHNLNADDGTEQEIRVKRAVFDPKWAIGISTSKHGKKVTNVTTVHDVLLLELEKPVKITENVRPICISKRDFKPDTMCYIAGWGSKSLGGRVPLTTLHEVAIPLVSRDTCNKPVSYSGLITEDMLCAGYKKGGKDTCRGDSGGPLMCQDSDKKWYAAGIASFGHEGCGVPNKYGIYGKLAKSIDWISKTTGLKFTKTS